MRENGLPRLITWRWAPCVALVLGSVSFVAFALVTIPDRIGHVDVESSANSLRLGAALARAQATPTSATDWSGDTTNTAAATPSPGVRSPSPTIQNADAFPKRGFSPPLERPEPPAVPVPPPQPLQLNVPPPVPAPPQAETPPPPAAAPAPAQPEVVPQAASAPPPVETPPPGAVQPPAAPAPAN